MSKVDKVGPVVCRHVPNFSKSVAVTIGNFDGVHLGHQALIRQLVSKANDHDLLSVLITFEPTPQEYFLGDNAPARITRLKEKLLLLKETTLDYVIILPFNQKMAALPAEDFIKEFLGQQLKTKYLLVGDDFHFGKNRLGNVALLEAEAKRFDYTVESLETHRLHDERVSSTRIRLALESGELALAKHLLGRAFTLEGRVIRGKQRGRTIGFPTANIALKRHRSPLLGVYAVKASDENGNVYNGVANIGNRPTVDGTRCLLEVHLFDFSTNIYDEKLKIEFFKKIRDEKRYDSFDELKQQIHKDSDEARHFLVYEMQ